MTFLINHLPSYTALNFSTFDVRIAENELEMQTQQNAFSIKDIDENEWTTHLVEL